MASLRKSNALSADSQTARFLYTILKQLDLKSVDWNQVADGLDITNGHAARMRFSRFKQHMEGVPSQPRTAKPKKEGAKILKSTRKKGLKRGLDDDVKGEAMKGADVEIGEMRMKLEAVKEEPSRVPDSDDIQERPAVRVKREIDVEGSDARQSIIGMGDQGSFQQHTMAPSTNLNIPSTSVSNAVPISTVSSPVATVSLADLHLSPKFQPPSIQLMRSAITSAVNSASIPASSSAAVTQIKSEPGTEHCENSEAPPLVSIKNAPSNF